MPSAALPVLATLDAQGNASLVDVTTPVIRANDLVVTRGEGVFETMRAFGGRAFLLSEHLERMARSAARIEVPLPDRPSLERLAACALEGFGSGDGSLRIVVTKGPDGAGGGLAFALATPVGEASVAARDGVRAITLTLGTPAGMRPDAPWLLGSVKSTSYAGAMAALRAADAAGAPDAIYLSGDGEVLEGPTSGVVAVVDGLAVTPPEDEVAVLPSTTVAFFGSDITCRRVSEAELRDASEVLLLSSVRGVVPVLELDGRRVGNGSVGPVGSAFRERYEKAVADITR